MLSIRKVQHMFELLTAIILHFIHGTKKFREITVALLDILTAAILLKNNKIKIKIKSNQN